ncbi:MAG: hypothetical protein KAH84_03940 [Thiomargarita sp.]|nr:hypothetical protein [Thiomargarita sp.]
MAKQQIHLSIIEEDISKIPEDIEKIGIDALNIFWQTSQKIAVKEINSITQKSEQMKKEVLVQRQIALEKAEQVAQKLATANATIETFKRENKSLQVDINRKNDTIKNVETQKNIFEEKIVEQEHEIRHLTGELGSSRENAAHLKRRLYEITRQLEQDIVSLKESREEAVVNLRTRERVDKDLKISLQEAKEAWENFKTEQRRSAVSEALVQEKSEAIKKLEAVIKLLQQEKHELKESLEIEVKVRVEVEKRIAIITARSDTQQLVTKEAVNKLEKELEVSRMEVTTLRNRMIKAESALERERKALERLETKLVAAASNI